ncbi:MAG: D-alanyl-D-alanine carboxypeptidase family protein [Firmicutes bacterium]|nr:D-alanyl-D-alanine carboxypeptidase family protein [Bacillota bacterium]
MTTKILMARIGLLVFCLLVAIGCLYTVGETSDPLARYTQDLSEGQKHLILQYLSDDDIDYMIDSQLKPDDFMKFIKIDGFNIKNAKLYTTALATQKASKTEIVNFVNKYRSHFTKNSLKNYLTYYSYTDLINFYETEQVLNPQLNLMENPENPYLILSSNGSIYKYAPQDLVEFKDIQVRTAMVEDLETMMADYKSTLNQSMKFLNGYKTYESLVDDFRIVDEAGPYVHKILHQAGSNEEQLGYTIVLIGQDEWLASCIEHLNEEKTKVDYDAVFDSLSPKLQDAISWIEDNAYHYGFVVRYTQEGESQTQLWYQPFLLRYVGQKKAKEMHNANTIMENTTFTKELK